MSAFFSASASAMRSCFLFGLFRFGQCNFCHHVLGGRQQSSLLLVMLCSIKCVLCGTRGENLFNSSMLWFIGVPLITCEDTS